MFASPTANEPYKLALLDAIPEGEPVTIYRQGDWLNLCRSPHVRHTGDAGTGFKLTHVARAYWRGDANNPMLNRIYGVAFADKSALDAHLTMLAEPEKRDHRRLGREMDLFHFEEVAPGAREAEDQTVPLRRHGQDSTQTLPLAEAVGVLVADARSPRVA